MSRLINPATDNQDKKLTYSHNLKRYNKAMRDGFYFEAILISYAMMEDRLRSFLYHMGLFRTRDSHEANVKKAKHNLREIIREYKRTKENDNITVNTITGKMKIIRCTMRWAEAGNAHLEDNYLKALRTQYDKYLDTEAILQTLSEIEKWCKYRNEIIHSLMNKNIESAYKDAEFQAAEGMRLCRELDSYVKYIKKGNRIRRSLNLTDK